MASLYFSTDLDPAVAPGDPVRISGGDARHAVTVARTRVGESLRVSDGAGLVVVGTVTALDPDVVELEVESVSTHQRPHPELWLAQALAKGDRDELAVQTATELGVSGIVPWAAERSVVRWDERKREKSLERWRTIVREASKQSLRAWVPDVDPLASTADLARLASDATVLVLDPSAESRLSGLDAGDLGARDSGARVVLVVGPEGGVSPSELERLVAAGALAVRLGDEVLRTSSAGPAALAVLNAKLGRW